MSPDPRDELRAGDRDREAVAQVLHAAMAEGRLDLHEVDDRLAATYAARTFADLESVVVDLPGVALPWREDAGQAPPLELDAARTSQSRVGVWTVPRRIEARASWGADVKLDFRAALCAHPRVDIAFTTRSGALVLVVPTDWSVDTDAVRVEGWGKVTNRHRAPAAPGRPTLVVTGTIGDGTVKTRGPYFYE